MNLKLLGIIYAAFVAVVALSAEIYAYVYDIEANSHIVDHYIKDVSGSESSPISLQEWMDRQDAPIKEFWDWFGYECAASFDPNISPYGYGHNDRD